MHDCLVGALAELSAESAFPATEYLFIQVTPVQESLLLGVIYKPSNASYDNDLETETFMHIPNNNNIILMDDFNTALNETNKQTKYLKS